MHGNDNDTELAYIKAVSTCAEEALDRSRSGEELHDVLHELVDGSQWVIYDWRARLVCKWSPNEDAILDVEGGELKAENLSMLWSRVAYYAMMQDCHDALDQIAEQGDQREGGAL